MFTSKELDFGRQSEYSMITIRQETVEDVFEERREVWAVPEISTAGAIGIRDKQDLATTSKQPTSKIANR